MSKQIHDESQRRKQVKFRANESMVDAFDEWVEESEYGSRNEALETLVGNIVEDGDELGTPLIPPSESRLSRAYKRLCMAANQNGIVRSRTARRACAGGPNNLGKDEVEPLLLRPLHKRGYISRLANVQGDTAWQITGWTGQ
jgi:hypothetical protein